MSKTFERRMLRARTTANDALSRSHLVIWCFEPENMPAMIDLMVAQGRLTDADRPHCVHWRTIAGAGTADDMVKVVDADEMLEQAGIRTLTDADRPHCVHWRTIAGAGTADDMVK